MVIILTFSYIEFLSIDTRQQNYKHKSRSASVTYYEGVKKMEEMGVNDNYIQGWVAGFLNNPQIEEQRITDEWESGFEDGKDHSDENFAKFC